jgi:SAM-dependent methyltransferase
VRQDERAPFVRALERARVSAYPRGEYVEQESFMRSSEILAMAREAEVARGIEVLDLCCGVAGPGRFITAQLGCSYLGVDLSPSAIDIARQRARDLSCQFAVARIPPVPSGPFDVVLLFETMLAFAEKDTLLRAVASALKIGGRFAFTIEAGPPLTNGERSEMPDADTVWLIPVPEILESLESAGLLVRWQEDYSRSHQAIAESLIAAFAGDASNIAAEIGDLALRELVSAHRLWSDWLRTGRVRKLAFVVEKRPHPEPAGPG